MPIPPDGIGLYRKDSAASHLLFKSSGISTDTHAAATLLLIHACLEFGREGQRRLASQITAWRRGITKLWALESRRPFGKETRSWHRDWNLITCPRFRIGVETCVFQDRSD
jgi:hypothetical protein